MLMMDMYDAVLQDWAQGLKSMKALGFASTECHYLLDRL